MSNSTPPLNGVTILDLSRVLAGPFCTMVLAHLGARVIKVEVPGRGDDARAFGPLVNGQSLYFASINCDKESIALDLKAAEDRAIFEELLGRADLLVENFRPGTMEDLGYSWELLHTRYPRLIYGAASGFGHTGPYFGRPAYDMVVQGMGGILSVTGPVGGPPVRVGVSIGDMAAALFLATGLNAALYRREKTGEGVKVDVAMLDCQVALLENALTTFLMLGKVAGPLGTRHPEIAPFQVFQAQDGPLVIAAGNDTLFAALARTLNRPDLLDDPRYRTNVLRRTNIDALEVELERTLATRPVKEWLRLLESAGVPCGPVNTVAEVAEDPQIAARNMIASIPDPRMGTIRVAGNPIKISGVPERTDRRPPPMLDGDRETILKMIQGR
jgi:CoA:oxalate CoA-transferase